MLKNMFKKLAIDPVKNSLLESLINITGILFVAV